MLQAALKESLRQIVEILDVLESAPSEQARAFYAEAGPQIRHVLDHGVVLLKGLRTGHIDYTKRNRGSAVESDPQAARAQLNVLLSWCDETNLPALAEPELDLLVMAKVGLSATANAHFRSNFPREVLFVMDHTIHHAAMIKLLGRIYGLELPAHIGAAPATAEYLRTQDLE